MLVSMTIIKSISYENLIKRSIVIDIVCGSNFKKMHWHCSVLA